MIYFKIFKKQAHLEYLYWSGEMNAAAQLLLQNGCGYISHVFVDSFS